MDPATTAIVSLVIAKVFALVALWLRLRWQAQREQQRHRYLLGVTEKVAPGGQMELDDRAGDGRRLQVKIICTPVPGEDQAA
ncbi:hypothetical protein ACH4UM_34225 [Streptomyces sp. NPDC020801]|uniref:hypothetical protein n=1 Tax=unclassified Streptomyces TaxID=2593676 RepID=UPI0037B3F6AE